MFHYHCNYLIDKLTPCQDSSLLCWPLHSLLSKYALAFIYIVLFNIMKCLKLFIHQLFLVAHCFASFQTCLFLLLLLHQHPRGTVFLVLILNSLKRAQKINISVKFTDSPVTVRWSPLWQSIFKSPLETPHLMNRFR